MFKSFRFSTLRTLRRTLGALGAIAIFAGAAHAQGTDAGTPVTNTFTLDYQVSGVDQNTITNGDGTGVTSPTGTVDATNTPTVFTVDRLVDHTVTATNSPLSVAPGASGDNATLSFNVTNTGNDDQSYSFSIDNTLTDDFDATSLVVSYSTDGGATFTTVNQVGTGTASAPLADITPDIAPGDTFIVTVSGTIDSSQSDGDFDDIVLVAQARDPLDWRVEGATGTQGQITENDADATNAPLGVAENVLADGDGDGAGTIEAAGDGLFTAVGRFVVVAPDIAATKTVSVLATRGDVSDPFDCSDLGAAAITTPAQYSTSGACVEYIISVANNAAGPVDPTTTATGVDILDTLPDELIFAAAVAENFDTAPTPVGLPAANTACDGAVGGSCDIEFTGGVVNAGNTTAQIRIRAIVE